MKLYFHHDPPKSVRIVLSKNNFKFPIRNKYLCTACHHKADSEWIIKLKRKPKQGKLEWLQPKKVKLVKMDIPYQLKMLINKKNKGERKFGKK